MDWRSRIVEQRMIPVADLHKNSKNWRRHPRAQKRALEGLLGEVGVVQGVIYNKHTERLIDGHLRVELAKKHGATEIPVTVVDLTEAEERLVLATLDPVGAMANTDDKQLSELLATVGEVGNAAVKAVLDGLSAPLPDFPADGGALHRDIRYTPAWATETLFSHAPPPPSSVVLDPCAGDGAILRVAANAGHPVQWVEVRQSQRPVLEALGPGEVGDWISMDKRPCVNSIVTNPPYSVGAAFMQACMDAAPKYCAALLRLNHLGSAAWLDFWQKYPPSGLVILASKRPSFSGDGRTDASEYAWAVWDTEISFSCFFA